MRAVFRIMFVGLALATGGCAASESASQSLQPASSGDVVASPAGPAIPNASSSSQVEVPMTPSPSHPSESLSPAPFVLHSAAFDEGGAIPRRYTCDGEDVSPDLAWSGAPDGTRSLALTVRDPDAGGFVHWLAFDIPGASGGELPAAVSRTPAAPAEGTNGFGRRGWGGPCPPSGTHHYVFTLYALDRTLELAAGSKLADVETALHGHVLASAKLTGTYRRG